MREKPANQRKVPVIPVIFPILFSNFPTGLLITTDLGRKKTGKHGFRPSCFSSLIFPR